MAKTRELNQLIEQATKQGFTFSYQPSGHWKAVSPDGKVISLASSPRSMRGVKEARSRLKRLGFKPTVPPKPKQKKTKAKEDEMALKVSVTEDTENTKDEIVPKVGELVELKSVITEEDVHKDYAMAGYTLWNAIHVRIKALPNAERKSMVLGKRPGKVWTGNRFHIMEDLWPGLPKHIKGCVGVFLNGSRNMACLVRGRGGIKSVWWISDEFDASVTSYQAARKTPIEWWKYEAMDMDKAEMKPSIVSEFKSEPKPKPNRGQFNEHLGQDGRYHCDKCSYSTSRVSALAAHINKLNGAEHPSDGVLPCKYCDETLSTHVSLSNHMRRWHRDVGEAYCRVCTAYYMEDPQKHRVKHLVAKNQERYKDKAEEKNTVIPETMMQPVTFHGENDDEIEKTVVAPDLSDALAAVGRIVDEMNRLREANKMLVDANNELAQQNSDLWEMSAKLQTQVDENSALVEHIQRFVNK